MITAFFRTVILYLLIIAGLRLMGKRQIGELEPGDLVVTLIISDLASVPMQDFGIPLVNGAFPIVLLLSLSMLVSYFSLKSIRFRSLSCGPRGTATSPASNTPFWRPAVRCPSSPTPTPRPSRPSPPDWR